METKQKNVKLKPDITKLKGKFRFNIRKCWIIYNAGDDEGNYNWPADKNYHHNALLAKIINLLNRRGFKVRPDETKDKVIRPEYKYGINKYGIEVNIHTYPAGFEIQFYQNVTEPENSNGGQYDFDKYERMPYLLKLSVTAEINAIIKLAGKFVKPINEGRKENAVEFILDRFQTNSFTKHHIKTLEDNAALMSDHDRAYNSDDRDKVKISNGDIKYFYERNRLMRGKAYHNINNMWWVILNDTEVKNMSSGSLFDFVPGTPFRKELTTPQKVQKLHTALKTAEQAQKYERCIVLRGLLQKYKLYRVWSLKWAKWWGPNCGGYTSDINQAGVYTHEQITGNPTYFNNLLTTEARPV